MGCNIAKGPLDIMALNNLVHTFRLTWDALHKPYGLVHFGDDIVIRHDVNDNTVAVYEKETSQKTQQPKTKFARAKRSNLRGLQ